MFQQLAPYILLLLLLLLLELIMPRWCSTGSCLSSDYKSVRRRFARLHRYSRGPYIFSLNLFAAPNPLRRI